MMSKMKTHDLPCLHVRSIRLLKASVTYALEWNGASRGSISVRAAGLIVEYWHGGAPVNQVVFTETTPRNFGGRQVWFTCPNCRRRCSILYLSNRLACRQCLRLAYRSQSEDALNRSYRKQRKIEQRLRSGEKMTNRTRQALERKRAQVEQARVPLLAMFVCRSLGLDSGGGTLQPLE